MLVVSEVEPWPLVLVPSNGVLELGCEVEKSELGVVMLYWGWSPVGTYVGFGVVRVGRGMVIRMGEDPVAEADLSGEVTDCVQQAVVWWLGSLDAEFMS